MVFDLQIIEEAAILTGIGMTTAFGLLVVLMITSSLTGLITVRVFDRRRVEQIPTSEELDLERRDRALAAVVAVTAVIENPEILDDTTLEVN